MKRRRKMREIDERYVFRSTAVLRDIRQCHQSHSAGLPARSTTWTQLPAAKSYASLNYRNAINSSPRDRQTDEETDSVATSAARH